MSTGFATLADSGRNERNSARAFAQRHQLEAVGFAGVGGEDSRTSSVRQDRHPPSTRNRLVSQKGGNVEEFLERVRTNHARLMKQCIDDRVGRRQGACMGRCRSRTRARPTRFYRYDRLDARNTPRNLAELLRVPEALQIQEDHRGMGILGPVRIKSFPETSILLPTDTKLEIPMLSCRA